MASSEIHALSVTPPFARSTLGIFSGLVPLYTPSGRNTYFDVDHPEVDRRM